MLFLTATSLGICAGMMRSAFSIALVAFLIVATFAAATAFSSGHVSWLNLLIAIVGYNAGLINVVLGMLAFRRLQTA